MEIIKVVLTGGPCAGKTTILNSIREYLLENNIPVFTVPETATELILNGIIPFSEETTYAFQSLVMQKQISKEMITEDYIRNVKRPRGKCIIIYDRGLNDNKAYLNKKSDYKKLLLQNGLAEIDALDTYDLVLDLLSTASCKEEAYNLNNKARMEDVEAAIELDKKTSFAWVAHRNLKIINSSVSIEEETEIVINYIKEILNSSQTKEIRRFLIDDSLSDYSLYNSDNAEELYITDYLLQSDNSSCNYVISKREYNGDVSYVYSVYNEDNDKIVVTRDKKITKREYFELLEQYKIVSSIERREISFIENKQKYRLCFYDDCTVLELEENKLNNELILPENLTVIGEVSNNYLDNINTKKKVRVREF